MALGVEVLVDRVFSSPRGVVWDDSHGVFVGDHLAQAIGVVGSVGHDDLGGQAVDQGISLRAIPPLASGQGEAHRAAEASDGHMDLGTQAAAGTAKGLIFRPPFLAPEAR